MSDEKNDNAERKRTPPRRKAKELAKYLRVEHPDYNYMKDLFRYLRAELEVDIPKTPKKLPYIPSEDELRRYYEVVWRSKNFQDMVIIKTLLYTGVRVSELVNIKLDDVDFDTCQIRINNGKGGKDRVTPFPQSFKEVLAMHADTMRKKDATYLFESSWKKNYTTRGIRMMLARYSASAQMSRQISPHQLRHFLLTWLKRQGIDDALIQPYSGHESRQSLEIYSKLAISDAQFEYDQVIGKFPI